MVRRFPVRLRDTRRHAWLQQRILRGSRLRPKEEARWAEESVGSTELFDHLTRATGRLRPRVLRPVPLRDDAPRRAARPRAGRPDPVPPRRAVRPPRRRPRGVPGLPGLHLQLAARGRAGREALRDRRPPGRRRGARLRSAAARRPGGAPPAPRPRGAAALLSRPEGDGQERPAPHRVRPPLPRRARLRPDARARRRRPGHRAAGHPGGAGPGLPRRRRQGGGLRGRHGGVPAVRQRVLLDRPDGSLARGDAGPRPRALRGHDAPRPAAPEAAWPSRTSTSSRRRSTSSSRTPSGAAVSATRAGPTSRPCTAGPR